MNGFDVHRLKQSSIGGIHRLIIEKLTEYGIHYVLVNPPIYAINSIVTAEPRNVQIHTIIIRTARLLQNLLRFTASRTDTSFYTIDLTG